MRSIFCGPLSVSPLSLLLILLAFVPLGCGPAEHDSVFDVTYDPCTPLVVEPVGSLRSAEVDSIDQALAMWNASAPLQLTRQKLDGAPRLTVRFEEGAPFVHGYYDDEVGEVIINRSLSDTRQRTITIAHELGHAFGLRHVARDKRRSLMNAGNLETTLTERDIQLVLQRWQGCAK